MMELASPKPVAACGVKVCGLTRAEDARMAWDAGAAALGFVFHPGSSRAVTAEQVRAIRAELPADAFCVGVFVDVPPREVNAITRRAGLSAAQLHGHESPSDCSQVDVPVIKAFRVEDAASGAFRPEDYHVSAFLADAAHPTLPGGTGLRVDWTAAAQLTLPQPLILAGGICADVAAEAIRTVCPAALDVCSSVEAAPGVKDHTAVRVLLQAVTAAIPLIPKGTRPCLIPK